MMQYFNNNPIRNLQQLNQARNMISTLDGMVAKARSGQQRGSEGLRLLDQLEEAIKNVKRQLNQ